MGFFNILEIKWHDDVITPLVVLFLYVVITWLPVEFSRHFFHFFLFLHIIIFPIFPISWNPISGKSPCPRGERNLWWRHQPRGLGRGSIFGSLCTCRLACRGIFFLPNWKGSIWRMEIPDDIPLPIVNSCRMVMVMKGWSWKEMILWTWDVPMVSFGGNHIMMRYDEIWFFRAMCLVISILGDSLLDASAIIRFCQKLRLRHWSFIMDVETSAFLVNQRVKKEKSLPFTIPWFLETSHILFCPLLFLCPLPLWYLFRVYLISLLRLML